MTPRTLDRITRLEAKAAPPSSGKHLAFKVEAPHAMPLAEIVTFLRDRGHAIHEDDDVFVMNLASRRTAESGPVRDLSDVLLTEEARAVAPPGGRWPSALLKFTFTLDSPRAVQ